MTRQPAGKPRDRRKGRRRPVPPRPSAVSRPRVAPLGSPTKAAESPGVTKPRVSPMDFSYVNAELRRILIFIVGMVALLIVLSFVLR